MTRFLNGYWTNSGGLEIKSSFGTNGIMLCGIFLIRMDSSELRYHCIIRLFVTFMQ